MNLSCLSEQKLKNLFKYWQIQDEYAEPLYNYLVYGYNPGSFWTNVLANNFVGAMLHSHPSNRIDCLKDVSRFIVNGMPAQCWGSYKDVDIWLKLSDEERRTNLEQCNLIYTPEEETWVALQGTYE